MCRGDIKSGGMREQRETSTNNANVTASVVFYLNQ